jgi:uncharacterized protein (DUF488 family)
VEISTIGFTQHTAEEFFETLRSAGIERLIDVRLNNSSHLAGFAKKRDLAYFLREICGVEYIHERLLAPTSELLDGYRKGRIPWAVYERGFLELMDQRRVEEVVPRSLFEPPSVLLCSEHSAEHCHRRLVVEYLDKRWGGVSVVHL